MKMVNKGSPGKFIIRMASSISLFSALSCRTRLPDNIEKFDSIISISSEADCTCALRASGKVNCWGDCFTDPFPQDEAPSNPSAEANKSDRFNIFTHVHRPRISDISMVTWGAYFIKEGNLWKKEYFGPCKGRCSDEPFLIKEDVQAISGASNSCLISKGEVFCNTMSKASSSCKDEDKFTSINFHDADSVSCGDFHCCAIRNPGDLYCWGSNEHGQISEDSPMKLFSEPFFMESSMIQVATSERQTCAIRSSGTVRCWGRVLPEDPSSQNSPN